jgi:hypothetical protein
LFYRGSGVSQRWEFKNTTRNVLQKNRVEKLLQKIRTKIQNRFFLDFFLSRFWAFLGEESSKTPQKISKNKSDPWSFFGLTHPPRGSPITEKKLAAPWTCWC